MSTKLICSLILILLSIIVYPQTWPILKTNDPGGFYILSCTLGEIHGTPLHEVIDIDCNNSGVEIGPIEDGIAIVAESDYFEIGRGFDGNVYQKKSFYGHLLNPGISEVENYIQPNLHLPGIPSADEMVSNGIDVGEMQIKLLQKIEELTLYVIELKKENEEMREDNEEMKVEIENLKRR